MILPIILAGGSGVRLWPLSRQLNPKQFLALNSHQSLLQNTICRLQGIEHDKPWLICNEQHRFLVAEQLRQLGIESTYIFLEPEGRNTAPALALAALQVLAQREDAVLLVMAADHVIQDKIAFHVAINQAKCLVESGKLVALGIHPISPETGYGYIKRGEDLMNGCYTVSSFVEKPDLKTAEHYLQSNQYLWNSGIFVLSAKHYIRELTKFNPLIVETCQSALSQSTRDANFIRVNKELFLSCPADSIDYAVMEKTDSAAVVPLDAGWSDIGSWSSLWDISHKNDDGNVLCGDVFTEQTSGTLVQAEHRLVAAVGVTDLIIVETKDAVLVAHKDNVQNVKTIVDKIKTHGRQEYLTHREVYRPWGMYDALDSGDRYQVKHITVNPGAKLSVQMHYHRAEHWIIVSGTAKVTRGAETYLLTENQSTYIPVGEIHALENPGKVPLELIEVQSGSYLGEDDILRLEDRYGRLDDIEHLTTP
ncbi:MAG: mannose-1-phosphate guanylyltransferase/mannose-6-phosphate isomerase [Legionella sp.]